MFVAAILAALPELKQRVFDDLAAVMPAGCGTPDLSEGLSAGISALRFRLLENTPAAERHVGTGAHTDDDELHHDHDQGHDDRHSHSHSHEHTHKHRDQHKCGRHSHGARYADLVTRIRDAALHPGTADQAIAILRRLAEAESRMHKVPVDAVHFHEVGDWDSLMDVVAAGSIAAAVAPCTWSVSDLPTGRGLVRTQHGLLPVPAPATAEILRGFHWRDDGIGGERVTPTGAAIIAHLANDAPPRSGMSLLAVGSGAGMRELPGMPNILRAMVYALDEVDQSAYVYADEIIVLSFDIDDMTGEEIGVAADRLRVADGVLDLSIGNRQGKKGRPMHNFCLLLRPDVLETVSVLCFHETSTIGVRWQRASRICLQRSADIVTEGDAQLRRKQVLRPHGQVSIKVESDDLSTREGLLERRRLKFRTEQKVEKEQKE